MTPSVHQINAIKELMTPPSTPGATDTKAADNRLIALDWLYLLDGRENPGHPNHHTYSGLYQKFLSLFDSKNPV